jgi:hypothetical protein
MTTQGYSLDLKAGSSIAIELPVLAREPRRKNA